jgi:hypothetical protein
MLINDAATLKANIGSIDANFTWGAISSFVQDVERDIITEAIGPEALLYFEGNLTLSDPTFQKALQLMQRAEAYIAIFKWSQFALYRITDKSLYVAKNGDGVIISDKKFRDFKTAAEEAGFNFLDKAIAVMEANLTTFAAYAASGTRATLMQGFIVTAADFHLQRSIDNSRLSFMSMHQIMLDVQDDFLPDILGAAYYPVFLDSFLDGDLTSDELKLLPFIKKAIAFLTVSRAVKQLPAKITSKGIMINKYNDNREYEQQEPAELARIEYLSDDSLEKGQRKLYDLKNFLVANSSLYPNFILPVTVTVTPNCADSGTFLM